MCTLDKPTASLSTVIRAVAWMTIVLNSCYIIIWVANYTCTELTPGLDTLSNYTTLTYYRIYLRVFRKSDMNTPERCIVSFRKDNHLMC